MPIGFTRVSFYEQHSVTVRDVLLYGFQFHCRVPGSSSIMFIRFILLRRNRVSSDGQESESLQMGKVL